MTRRVDRHSREVLVIRVLDGMPDGVLGIEAAGKLSSQDYTQVLAPALAGRH